MQLILPQIEAQGSTLIAISPQTAERSRATVEELGLTYPVLSDPFNRLARQLGLVFRLGDDLQAIYRRGGYDLPVINGDDSWELPVPATFIVDQTGTIRWAFVEPNYMKRAEPSEFLPVLESLRRDEQLDDSRVG